MNTHPKDREIIAKSLELIDDLEYFIEDSKDEIQVINIHCRNFRSKYLSLVVRDSVSRKDADKIIPFYRDCVQRGYYQFRGYIKFKEQDEIRPEILNDYPVGWGQWEVKRVGPSYNQIRKLYAYRGIPSWDLSNRFLVEELQPLSANIVSAELSCGEGWDRTQFKFDRTSSTPDELIDFIVKMGPSTKRWEGRIAMGSNVEYHPVLKNGELTHWLRKICTPV